ncbi:MAG TPA: hypothetical protein VIA29_04315 [Thermoanaerobaculia bacterium]
MTRLVALAASISLLLAAAGRADPIIRISGAGPDVVVSGTTVSFELLLRNVGTDPSGPLALELNADTFLGAPQTPGLFCGDNPAPGQYVCIGPLLGPGDVVGRIVTFAVDPRAHQFRERVSFSAYLYRPGFDPPVEGETLVRFEPRTEGIYDLAITVDDSPDPVPYGGTVTLAVTMGNRGPSTLVADTSLGLDLDLAPGVSGVTVNDSLWSCTPNRCTSQILELRPGTSRQIELTLTAEPNQTPMRTGIALRHDEGAIRGADPNRFNNGVVFSTQVNVTTVVPRPARCPMACVIVGDCVRFFGPTATPTPSGPAVTPDAPGPTVTPRLVRAGATRAAPSSEAANAPAAASTFSIFTDLRDGIFSKSAAGRNLTTRHYAAGAEAVGLLDTNAALRGLGQAGVAAWSGHVEALNDGRGAGAIVTAGQIDVLEDFLDALFLAGSPELRAVIQEERLRLNLSRFVGMSMDAALVEFERTIAPVVTLPVAATIRGAGGSFFHSDVRLYNPGDAPVNATLRFRCASGNCGAASRSMTLAPREMVVADDALAALFGSSDAFGALEIEGDVLVDSRLYTPERAQPTSGFFVPGQTPDAAYPESVLLALSHSNDRGRGFRTNLGFFNPNDVPLTATVSLHAPDASIVGQIVREVPARTALQINDVFREAGIAADVPDAYAVIRADGVHGRFAYAGIVDNRTQDGLLVRSRASRGGPSGTVLLPAAASLPGVGGAYFRSDVRVFNPYSAPIEVTARYLCSVGPCPSAAGEATFTLAPREMRVFDDAVATLFAAPGTLGAVEFSGEVYVDSRLYTPSRTEPSLGMYLPGGRLEELDETEAILTSLSHSPDLAAGFRSNIGVYNPFLSPQDVSVTVHSPQGTAIGSYSLTVPGKTLVQTNAFDAAGISQAVADAYAIVRTEGFGVVSYAAVADNRSQDPVFIPARRHASAFGAGEIPLRFARAGGVSEAAASASSLLVSSLAALVLVAAGRRAIRG